MAIHDTPFYHKIISNTTLAVGTLIDNLKIVRTDKTTSDTQQVAVPVKYGRKEHWYLKLNDNQKDSSVTHQQSLPRIFYALESVSRDTTKSKNRLNKIHVKRDDVDALGSRDWCYMPVPVKLNYTISIMTKYMDDGCQIIEQLLPYFNPTVNLKITEVSSVCAVNDVQITLEGDPVLDDNYDEGFNEARFIVWTLSVTAATNIYQEVRNSKVIRRVIVDLDNLDPLADLETITVEANDGEYENKENSTITIEIDV